MTTPDADPPFVRHQKTAEAMLRALAQALQPSLSQGGSVAAEELARAVELVVRRGAALAPLFAQNCRACAAHGAAAGVAAAYQADQRRRDYVTRLLYAAVAAETPESVDPLTGETFPRVLAAPLQSHIAGLFYEKEWEAMNADALLLYQKIGSDADDAVWEKVHEDDALPFLADAVFIRVLLRFRQFAFQRQNFIRRMGELLRERRFVLTDAHFVALFDAMFGRLRPALKSELGRARIDIRYGEETASSMLKIFDEFDKHCKELAMPIKTLAGAQKLMQARREPGTTTKLMPRAARF
jgi:hypothetical protein